MTTFYFFVAGAVAGFYAGIILFALLSMSKRSQSQSEASND